MAVDGLPHPPKFVTAFLRMLLTASSADSVLGDLLEEYRELRQSSIGRTRANLWYSAQVASIFWHATWPYIAALIAVRILSFPLPGRWNPSLVPAPGVSALDAIVFLVLGFHTSRQTNRVATAIVTCAVTSVPGVAVMFVYAASTDPTLLLAPFEKPFILVIVLTLVAIAVGFAVAAGTAGAVVSRLFPPRRTASIS